MTGTEICEKANTALTRGIPTGIESLVITCKDEELTAICVIAKMFDVSALINISERDFNENRTIVMSTDSVETLKEICGFIIKPQHLFNDMLIDIKGSLVFSKQF